MGRTHPYLGDLDRAKQYEVCALTIEKNKPASKHNSNSGCIYQKPNDLDHAMEHQEPLNVTTTDGLSGHVHDELVEDLEETRSPFLELPGNFSGPKSNIQIEI